MKAAIIGCGLIGQKRAKIIAGHCQLAACIDQQFDKANALASQYPDCIALTDWRQAIHHPHINIILICTIHATLAEIAAAAAEAGKHILIEKPAGRRVAELDLVIKAAQKTGALVRVGFNHRYHRAFRKARELVDQGALGELMFIRARYGHGGRVGYEKEWRADPILSGGGELLDQGIHLIDLARWFLGDFTEVQGHVHTYFWNMPVDDNGFLLLKTPKKQVAFLHASCTEWKNLFSFELYGKEGKIDINGLGGSYGTESITYYKMLPQMGPPETYRFEYPMPDDSWEVEINEFIDDIKQHRQPQVGLHDAQAALRIVEAIYRISGI